MKDLAIAAALAASPSLAFAELRERPRFWFPLLAVVLSTAGLMIWFYSAVDFEWFRQTVLANTPDFQKLPEDQRAQALSFMGRNMMMIMGTVGVALGVPIFYLLQSVYFLIAGKVTKVTPEPQFKHWFALSCWAGLPAVLTVLVSAILILMRDDNQIGLGILQPLSLNELFFHYPAGSKPQGFLDALAIPTLLSWALMIIGVRTWSQRSWLFSFVFAMVPGFLIFGIWAIFAFR